MSKLDRSRPYAEQFPSGNFEQDNKWFDRNGYEIDPVIEPVVEAAPSIDMPVLPPERRRVDLRLKENRHLRPYWNEKENREKSGVAH
jgi:hypothetical protein